MAPAADVRYGIDRGCVALRGGPHMERHLAAVLQVGLHPVPLCQIYQLIWNICRARPAGRSLKSSRQFCPGVPAGKVDLPLLQALRS